MNTGRLSVRLARHEQEPGAGGGVGHRELLTRTEQDELRRPRPPPVGSERGLAVEHVGEALELGRDAQRGCAPVGELDVEHDRGRPELYGRALTDEHPDRRVAFLPHRDLVGEQHLSARLGLLVLAGEVHPEQHAPPLGVAEAFRALLRADPLGVPRALPGPEREERALGQPCPFDRAVGSGAVTGARRALEDVPEVVEPTVRVLGVDVLQFRKPEACLVHEDERVHLRVGHGPRGQRLEDLEPHHRPDVRVLHEDRLSRCQFGLLLHGPHPLSRSRALVSP